MNDAAIIVLTLVALVAIATLVVSMRQFKCIHCGKPCWGRRGAGTVDDPICIDCHLRLTERED